MSQHLHKHTNTSWFRSLPHSFWTHGRIDQLVSAQNLPWHPGRPLCPDADTAWNHLVLKATNLQSSCTLGFRSIRSQYHLTCNCTYLLLLLSLLLSLILLLLIYIQYVFMYACICVSACACGWVGEWVGGCVCVCAWAHGMYKYLEHLGTGTTSWEVGSRVFPESSTYPSNTWIYSVSTPQIARLMEPGRHMAMLR